MTPIFPVNPNYVQRDNLPRTTFEITIHTLYGFIYGGIILFLLLSALIITEIPLLSNLFNSYSTQSTVFNPFVCTFKKITGLPCMTCGGTRSFFYLAHLKLYKSFLMNPIIFLSVMALLLYGLISLIRLITKNNNPLRVVIPIWLKRILVILLISSALINWAYLIFIGKP
ncbi:MAG: DUF2752 domain-containing protein [Planctomycetota bacterium]